MTTKVYKITYTNGVNRIVVGDEKLAEATLNTKHNYTVKELNTNAYAYRENN